MDKKIITIISVSILVIGGGAFYGGMKYGQSTMVFSGKGNFSAADMQVGSINSPQARFQQRSSATGGANTGMQRMSGGGMIIGEILSKDDKSVTVKMQDGGSKIIFLSDSVLVNKSVVGSSGDLKIGESVSVTGSANSDGSINAKSIQIQPK